MYSANNPVNAVDLDGRVVTAPTSETQRDLLMTIPPELRAYISFSNNGRVTVDMVAALNDYRTTSEFDGKRLLDINPYHSNNFKDLSEMSTNEEFNIIIGKNPEGHLNNEGKLVNSWKKLDAAGSTLKTSLMDSEGRTIIQSQYNSSLGVKTQIKTLSHEIYGHAIMDMLNRNSKHGNPELDNRIKRSQEELYDFFNK